MFGFWVNFDVIATFGMQGQRRPVTMQISTLFFMTVPLLLNASPTFGVLASVDFSAACIVGAASATSANATSPLKRIFILMFPSIKGIARREKIG